MYKTETILLSDYEKIKNENEALKTSISTLKKHECFSKRSCVFSQRNAWLESKNSDMKTFIIALKSENEDLKSSVLLLQAQIKKILKERDRILNQAPEVKEKVSSVKEALIPPPSKWEYTETDKPCLKCKAATMHYCNKNHPVSKCSKCGSIWDNNPEKPEKKKNSRKILCPQWYDLGILQDKLCSNCNQVNIFWYSKERRRVMCQGCGVKFNSEIFNGKGGKKDEKTVCMV